VFLKLGVSSRAELANLPLALRPSARQDY